jgi:ArsR family transcriptional regulator
MLALLSSAKAFSEPTRVRIIWALRSGELCVCELCDALDAAQSTLSSHLQYLRQAGFVTTRQEGKWVYYELTPSFRRMAKTFSKLHSEDLEADLLLRKDAKRLEARLQQRDAGACCVGFSQPSPKRRARPIPASA